MHEHELEISDENWLRSEGLACKARPTKAQQGAR
jgi:hypothetical protein